MRKLLAGAACAAALGFVPHDAFAVDAIVPFTGLVTATCVLTVGTPGVMAASTDFTSLRSTNAGGAAGSVQALSTGTSFRISTIAPTAFTAAPAGGGDSVIFTSTYSGSGATSIGPTPGTTATTLSSGLTNISVNLAANKSAGTFNGGAYAAEVIVRCE